MNAGAVESIGLMRVLVVKVSLNHALVSFALVCPYYTSYIAWLFTCFVLLLVVVLFSFVNICQVIG